jgi:hypothetical protein
MARLYRTIGVALLAAAAGVGSTTAAAAEPTGGATTLSPARGYVDGDEGAWTDDLDDEADLYNGGPYWHSNYAGMWQTILWADNMLERHEIDCRFGPRTAAATAEWQRRFGIWYPVRETGRFDLQTRRLVASFLVRQAVSRDGDGDYLRYNGAQGKWLDIRRHDGEHGANWRWDISLFGEWRGAWYNVENFTTICP